jgi:hypothetical protein
VSNKDSPYSSSTPTNKLGVDYDYFGPGLSIIPKKLFSLFVMDFLKFRGMALKHHNIKMENVDDVFISWVAKCHGYKIQSFAELDIKLLGADK